MKHIWIGALIALFACTTLREPASNALLLNRDFKIVEDESNIKKKTDSKWTRYAPTKPDAAKMDSPSFLRIRRDFKGDNGRCLVPGHILWAKGNEKPMQFNFLLTRYVANFDVLLPQDTKLSYQIREIVLDNSRAGSPCDLTQLQLEWIPLPTNGLARAILDHAPLISARADLYGQSLNDRPLLMGYTVYPHPTGYDIAYHVGFSDQDAGKSSIKSIRKQTARWSRRLDVETAFWISLDTNYKLQASTALQPKSFLGTSLDLGSVPTLRWVNPSSQSNFKGKYFEDSKRPILYNSGSHHNFSDHPLSGVHKKYFEGYAFYPATSLPSPDSRDDLFFKNPWTFVIRDFELLQSRRLEDTSSDYLYVKIHGTQKGKTEWKPYVYLPDSDTYYRIGRGDGSMNHIDKSGSQKSGYASIYVGAHNIDDAIQGRTKLLFFFDENFGPYRDELKSPRVIKNFETLKINNIQIYRLIRSPTGYSVEDISRHFKINIDPQGFGSHFISR